MIKLLIFQIFFTIQNLENFDIKIDSVEQELNKLSTIINYQICYSNSEIKQDNTKVDLLIKNVYFNNSNILGLCSGTFLENPKVKGIPIMYIDCKNKNTYYETLLHEFGHFLGLTHSIDSLSFIYPAKIKNKQIIQRIDSLKLKELYEIR